MANIKELSLKAAPLQFAAFTPMQYTMETADPTLLAKSLTMQEAREKESKDTMDLIDTSINAYKEQLNVNEHGWLKEKADKIRNDIDYQIDLGNYQTAIRLAKDAAKDFKRDEDLSNKMKVNEIYTKQRDKIQSGNYSQYLKNYWDYRNQYSYNGTADWKPNWNPVAELSVNATVNLVNSLTSEDAQSNSAGWSRNGETMIDKNGNAMSAKAYTAFKDAILSVSSNSGGSSSRSVREKSKARLEKTFRDLLDVDDVRDSFSQYYEIRKWNLDEFDRKANDMSLSETDRQSARKQADALRKDFTDKNGIIISDYDTWIDDKVIPLLSNIAYRNTSTSSESRSGFGYSGAGGGSTGSRGGTGEQGNTNSSFDIFNQWTVGGTIQREVKTDTKVTDASTYGNKYN